MNKKNAYWMIVVIVITCLIGCQPTPDDSVVVGKNDLESTIEEKTTETQTININEGQNITINSNGTLSWQEQYIDSQGIFKVTIEAELTVPDVDNFSVFKVEPVSFTGDQLNSVVEAFIGNNKVYDGDLVLTKEELAEAIVEAKKQKQDAEANGWSGAIYSDEYIAELEEQYQSAPETIELEEIEPSWIELSNGNKKVNIISVSEQGNYDRIRGGISDNSSYIEYVKESLNYKISGSFSTQPSGVSITENDALLLAQEIMNKLDLNDFQLSCVLIGSNYQVSVDNGKTVDKDDECYVLCYTRDIEGIPITYVQMASGDTESESYSPAIKKEYLRFYINDSGIERFEWRNPYEEIENISRNVQLLSFSEIQEIFIEQMKMIGYGRNEIYNSGTLTVINDTTTVFKVSLGMMTILNENDLSTYLCIPVWDFFATVHKDYSDGTSQDGWDPEGNDAAYSVLTINAIDGSIINRNLGY